MSRVVKTTCFLADMNDFQAFNGVYAEYFPSDPPARTTIQAGRLPLDLKVEIEAIAEVD
jgi:2-iminobutanoate/2-iminopropanoate deaminase